MTTKTVDLLEVTPTSFILAEMLTENTGRHLGDSGGAYGRNWERNRGKTVEDFLAEPETTLTGRWGLEVTHSVFHFLNEALEYEPKADNAFEIWCNAPENKEEGWLGLMELFAHELGATGPWGDGAPITINTYNREDLLSQTIQYTIFRIDRSIRFTYKGPEASEVVWKEVDDLSIADLIEGEIYVLLQIHGGCDVRGGYTQPRLFRVLDDGCAILDNAAATIFCTNHSECNTYWTTLDGYDWDSGDGNADNLKDMDLLEGTAGWARALVLRVLDEHGEEPADWGYPTDVIPTDGDIVYCPLCGNELKAGLR